VVLPIELRGQQIGVLKLRRIEQNAGWSESEKELMRETIDQLALSLENARLMEEIRAQAGQEEMINQIVARTQSSLNLETVMRTAVSEIGRMMRLSHVRLRLGEGAVGEGVTGEGPNGHREQDAPDETEAEQAASDHPETIEGMKPLREDESDGSDGVHSAEN
jgi:hypothetical protein